MTKFRGLVLAGLIGVLALWAPPAQGAALRPSAVAVFSVSPLVSPVLEQTAPPGPVLDPNGTTVADAKQTKNKLIAGGTAIVLLFLVWWGRRVRNPKTKKKE